MLFKDCPASSHCFEPGSSSVTPSAIFGMRCLISPLQTREPAGSPNTAFPLGLRVRGLLLPLSCHTLLGMLSILQGTDVRAYLPSRPAVCPSSSTGRLRKPSQVPPPMHKIGQTVGPHKRSKLGCALPGPDSHVGGETFIIWDGEQLLEWATLSIRPLSCVRFVKHDRVHRAREKQHSF